MTLSKIVIDTAKCVGCGSCVRDCVAGYLYMEEKTVKMHDAGCISCGHCYAVCPVGAVSLPEQPGDGGEYVEMTEFDSSRLLQAMKSRRSIRQFKPKPIEQEKLEMILEAGRYCPTGSNSQNVAYTILGSKQDEIEKICVDFFRKGIGAAGFISDVAKNMKIDDHFFFKGAPLVIVVSAKSAVDGSLVSSYMELMAESLGLGVLYSGFFIACSKLSGKVKKELELPQGHKPVTCMVIGYPDVKYYRIPGRNELNVRTL